MLAIEKRNRSHPSQTCQSMAASRAESEPAGEWLSISPSSPKGGSAVRQGGMGGNRGACKRVVEVAMTGGGGAVLVVVATVLAAIVGATGAVCAGGTVVVVGASRVTQEAAAKTRTAAIPLRSIFSG